MYRYRMAAWLGENVPRERVERAWAPFDRAEVLLVAGSSLAIYSGRRVVQRAQRDGVPLAVVNLGPDGHHATLLLARTDDYSHS